MRGFFMLFEGLFYVDLLSTINVIWCITNPLNIHKPDKDIPATQVCADLSWVHPLWRKRHKIHGAQSRPFHWHPWWWWIWYCSQPLMMPNLTGVGEHKLQWLKIMEEIIMGVHCWSAWPDLTLQRGGRQPCSTVLNHPLATPTHWPFTYSDPMGYLKCT